MKNENKLGFLRQNYRLRLFYLAVVVNRRKAFAKQA